MKIVLNGIVNQANANNVSIRCPHCGHNGVFIALAHDLHIMNGNIYLGQRKCPNEKCNGHVFFIKMGDGNVLTYPSEIIPFEKTNIPERILVAFEEAIICHSNRCFIASAIMIRKTLEEVCHQKILLEIT